VEWDWYVIFLTHSAIKLIEEEDKISWSKNLVNGEYMVKLGHEPRIIEDLHAERVLWWRIVWKLLYFPLNHKIILRLALENEILTRDNGHKRNLFGPRKCVL